MSTTRNGNNNKLVPGASSAILNPKQLKNLGLHKYSSTSSSLLDPVFQPFWNHVTHLLPMSLAPNVLTITGLGLNIVTSIILFLYSPDLRERIPGWACLLSGIGIFIYQTLDAIDGKQARRTNSSSPLGELFDHGCDSMSTVFLTLGIAATAQLGPSKLTFIHCAMGSFLFYCVHWRTYVTGHLYFGKVDVTEAELSIILVHLVSGLLGNDVWAGTPIGFLGLEWRVIIILLTIAFELFSMAQTFRIVYDTYCEGKGGGTVAGTSVLSPATPIALVLAPMITIAVISPTGIYQNHPVIYILTFGLICSKITDRLIIAHMTKSPIPPLDRSMIGPGLMLLNLCLGSVCSEYILLWLTFIVVSVDIYAYCSRVCKEICDYLSISLFTI